MNSIELNYKAFKTFIGIQEECNVIVKDDIRTIKLVTGLDVIGRVTNPYIYDSNRGFIATKSVLTNEDEIITFCRSHKPLYLLLAENAVICKGLIKLNLVTGEVLLDKSKINFYVPQSESNGKMLCYKLGGTQEIGTIKYQEDILTKLKLSLATQLNTINTESRQSFLKDRLLNR